MKMSNKNAKKLSNRLEYVVILNVISDKFGIINIHMIMKMRNYYDSIKTGLKTTYHLPEIVQNGRREKVGNKYFISREIRKCF